MTRPPRGFTLVELMIVVAIIGVLAAVAITGVRRYLEAARSGEAKNNVGEIARCAQAAFDRELLPSGLLPEGQASVQVAHMLCDSAQPVPAAVLGGRKYQPHSAAGLDFDSGTTSAGWRCLRFHLNQAIYYQYWYTSGASPVSGANNPAACSGVGCFEAAAKGDGDADGVFSSFARTGFVNNATGALRLSTQLYVENESE